MHNPAFLGQARLVLGQDEPPPMTEDGEAPPPEPEPPPSPPPEPPPANGGKVKVIFFPRSFPQYYPVYPVYPPQPERTICRKLEKESEEEGRDVFECVQEPRRYTYPVTYFRPWWF